MMQFNPRTALQREKENGRSVARLMRKAARVRGDDLARQVGWNATGTDGASAVAERAPSAGYQI